MLFSQTQQACCFEQYELIVIWIIQVSTFGKGKVVVVGYNNMGEFAFDPKPLSVNT